MNMYFIIKKMRILFYSQINKQQSIMSGVFSYQYWQGGE